MGRTPHHGGRNELSPYREGIVLKKTIIHPKKQKLDSDHNQQNTKRKNQRLPKLIKNMLENKGNDNIVSIASIGLNQHCVLDKRLEEDTRITVKIENYKEEKKNEDDGYYFG